MKYTETHEWVDVHGDLATVGITHYAQKELGDIVYVELPIIGKVVKAGQEIAVLESTKAAADVYSPISGTIEEVNTLLSEKSDLINTSPETEGWILKLRLSNHEEVNRLLDKLDYEQKLNH